MSLRKEKNINEKIILGEIKKNLSKAKKVKAKLAIWGSSEEAYSFIITVLELIYNKEFTIDELENIIIDWNWDKNIDALYIRWDELNIFDISFDNPSNWDVQLFEISLKNYIFRTVDEESKNKIKNNKLKEKIDIIWNKTYKKNIYIVRLSDWNWKSEEINSLKQYIETKKDSKFFYYNSELLVNHITEKEQIQSKEEISFNTDKFKYITNLQQGFWLLSLNTILGIVNKSNKKGYNLFHKNIRKFLNKKNLSQEIICTIKKTPEKFHLYHNWIVLTAKEIYDLAEDKIEIINLQIVNWAQTINWIFEHYKNDLKNTELNNVYILCKLVKADDTLSEKICETANTQINISLWDLCSNDDIQFKIEKIINNNSNYLYVRKWNTRSKTKFIIKLDNFFQFAYSVFFQKPAEAKNKKKNLFLKVDWGLYFDICKKIEKNFYKIEKICELMGFIDKKIKNEKDKIKKWLIKDSNFHIAGIFYNKNYDINDKNFNIIFSNIEKYVNNKRKKEPELSNNKIFTKSDELYKYLLKNIKK